MRKIVSITNCQGPVLLQRFLRAASADFAAQFQIMPAVQVHLLSGGDAPRVRAALAEADTIVAQPIRNSIVAECTIAHLRATVKAAGGAKELILFPALHFDALQFASVPCPWKGPGYPFGATEDMALAAAYVAGLSPEAAVAFYHDEPLADAETLHRLVEANIHAFETREADAQTDLPMSCYYRANWRRERLHHVKSHPCANVYRALSERLAQRLGLEDYCSDRLVGVVGNNQFELPIKVWVQQALALEFASDPDQVLVQNQPMPFSAFIARLFAFYDTVGAAEVKRQHATNQLFAGALARVAGEGYF